MNKLLLDTYLGIRTKFSVRLAGPFIWKKVLRNNGVKNINVLTENKKDEISMSIYNSLFKESQKDKKISLKGIGKTYENGFKAIHNFNLDVNPKEFVCLLGPSGCGKTTALRMVAGLESITEGKYIAGSQEMNSVHPSERNTAMVFQNYALYPFMTVYDNIAFGLKLKTFKNPVYKNSLKEFYDHYLPNHEIIKDSKFKIYDVKHKFRQEIIEKKIIHRKLAKEGKHSEAQALKDEIQDIFEEKKADKIKRKAYDHETLELLRPLVKEKKLVEKELRVFGKVIKENENELKSLTRKKDSAESRFNKKIDASNAKIDKVNALIKDSKKFKKENPEKENHIEKYESRLKVLLVNKKKIEEEHKLFKIDINTLIKDNDKVKNENSNKLKTIQKKDKLKRLNRNNFMEKNKNSVPVIKEVIRDLIIDQKEQYKEIISFEKNKVNESGMKIRKLLKEQEEYKTTKRSFDEEIAKKLIALKKEKKLVEKELRVFRKVIKENENELKSLTRKKDSAESKFEKEIHQLKTNIDNVNVLIKDSKKLKKENHIEKHEEKLKVLLEDKKKIEEEHKLFCTDISALIKDNEKAKIENSNKLKTLQAQDELKLLDIDNFKEKHRKSIPMIKEEIKLLKIEQKNKQTLLSEKLNELVKLAKDEKNLVIVNKGRNEIEKIETSISEIGIKILEDVDKISIINKCNKFVINELKGKTSLRKSIKSDLSESAVIWKRTIPARVRQLSTLVGIRDYLKRKPAALSGGQRQRVALIRAISKNSQLFLFDEPLSNLDAKLRSTMRSEIRKIHKSVGATSLYVTHDQIEAMTMADKVVVINLGYIQQVGSPRDLYENPSNIFVARFIGVPTINMMDVKLDTVKAEYKVAGTTMKYKLSDEKMKKVKSSKENEVLLGIRPNDIVLSKSTGTGLIGKVMEKELIGSEYVIDMELKSGKVVKALASVHDHVEIGEKFNIEFAPNKVSFFSKKTGKAISSIINAETAAALDVWDESAEERIKNLMILDKDRNAQTIGKKLVNVVKESTNQEFRKTQLHKKINELQNKKEDYKVFDENEINS